MAFKNLKTKYVKNRKNRSAGISEKVIRLLEIYTLIAQNQYPSINYLAERYSVTERTVYRYLQIIGFIDLIEFDRDRDGYKFVAGDRIKKLILSDDELLFLLTIGETVSHLGTPFRENFQGLVDRMMNISKTSLDKGSFPVLVKMPDAIETEKTNSYLKTVTACINEKRSMDIVYKALHSKEVTERRVNPYGLVFYEGAWNLAGYCHLRKTIRKFSIDQIMDLKETNFYFKRDEDFNIEEYTSDSWGIYNDDRVNVTVRFSSKVADYITRRQSWHPSEKRKILPSGDVELTFTVAGVDEIKRWIYLWLPNVEVLKPKWLKERIRKELSTAAQNHS